MSSQKHKAEKNIQKLRDVEALISQGMNPPDASRQVNISIRTFYRWRKDYGRMRVDQAKRLIDLEKENLRLKHLDSDKEYDTQILKLIQGDNDKSSKDNDLTKHSIIELKNFASNVEHNPAPILQTKYDGTILDANPVAVEIFEEKIIGKSIFALIRSLKISHLNKLTIAKPMQVEELVRDCTYLFTIKKDTMTKSFFLYGSKFMDDGISGRENLTFARAIEQAPTSILITDAEGKVEYVNSEFRKRTGYKLDEVKDKDTRILYSGAHPKMFYRDLFDTILSGNVWQSEICIKKKNGDLYWNLTSISGIVNTQGRITNFVVAEINDRERKKAEKELQNEKIFLETLFQNAPEAIAVLEDYDLITNINHQFELLFGYTKEYSIGKSLNDIIVSEKFKEEAYQVSDKVTDGQRIFLETKRKNKDGNLIDVSLLGAPIINKEGDQIGTYAIYRDLTESHVFQKILINKEKRLEAALDAAVNAIITINENGVIDSFNKAAVRIFGYTEEEVIGENIKILMPEPDKSKHDSYINNYHRTGVAKIIDVVREVVGRRKTGETFPLKLSVSRVELGSEIIFTGLIDDLTEQKQAEKEKLELQEKLIQSQRMESLGLLAGGVAHDLNNIIGPIMAYPDLIKMSLLEGKTVEEDLDAISSSAQRAADVISDLLALTRRGNIMMAPTDLNDLIKRELNSATTKEYISGYRNIKLKVNLAKDLSLIAASHGHLPKVIMNLVNNAFESMPKGGILSIKTSSINLLDENLSDKNIPQGRYNLLTIEDQGEGIPEENISKIFDPFFTTKMKSGKSGTGLGLSVVYNVLKDHGAHVKVESKLGIGTKFSIYFPAMQKKGKRVSKVKQKNRGFGIILVVDDRKEQREIAKRILSSLGYKVEGVESGREAINYLKKKDVDLVLLDMILEDDMDGLDTYREIINIKPGQKTVIISGYSESRRVIEAKRLGVNAFLQKPYKLVDMRLIIKTVLGDSKISLKSGIV